MEKKIKKLQSVNRELRQKIKRLRFLAIYALPLVSEADYDDDKELQKAFEKCDRAGDLG